MARRAGNFDNGSELPIVADHADLQHIVRQPFRLDHVPAGASGKLRGGYMRGSSGARVRFWRHRGVMSAVRAIGVAVFATLLSACGEDSTAPEPNVNGRWIGTATVSGGTMNVDLTLANAGSVVTGNGTVGAAGESIAVTVSGTYSHPTLSVTISASGFEAMNYTGQVADNIMAGSISGSGFNGVALNMVRQ